MANTPGLFEELQAKEQQLEAIRDIVLGGSIPAPIQPSEAEGVTTMTTRFPASMAAQIRFVAGSTFGMTVNSFVVDAVREKLAQEKKLTHP